MYADYGRKYLDEYLGMYRCHYRALSNVNIVAAAEACTLGITHDEPEKVFAVLSKYEDGTNGKVFHLRKKHWVALQRVPDSGAGFYYDDTVLVKVCSYSGAANFLKLVQDMTQPEYRKVFHGGNTKKKNCSKTTNKDDIKNDNFSKTMRKLQEKQKVSTVQA